MIGKVKWFNKEKGFGFITGTDNKDVFLHGSDIAFGTELRENDTVEYEMGEGHKGPKAINVAKVNTTRMNFAST